MLDKKEEGTWTCDMCGRTLYAGDTYIELKDVKFDIPGDKDDPKDGHICKECHDRYRDIPWW